MIRANALVKVNEENNVINRFLKDVQNMAILRCLLQLKLIGVLEI